MAIKVNARSTVAGFDPFGPRRALLPTQVKDLCGRECLMKAFGCFLDKQQEGK